MSIGESHGRSVSTKRWLIGGAVVAFVVVMLLLTSRHDDPVLHLDSQMGLPQPPVHAPYDGTSSIVAIIWLSMLGLIGVGFATRDFIRTRSPLALFVTLSAPMIIFPEVFVDIMGAVWYPVSGSDHAFTIFGRQMGWFIVAGWFGFGGLFMYLIYKMFETQVSTRAIWLAYAAAAAGSVLFEEILQEMGGIYIYFANQPLIVLFKLPWWWIPCNAGGVFLAAALAYRLRESLRGWRGLTMFAITPASMGAVYAAIALPSWIVVNGNYDWWVTQLAGLTTIALGVGVIAIIIKVVIGRNPMNFSGHDGARAKTGGEIPVGSAVPKPAMSRS